MHADKEHSQDGWKQRRDDAASARGVGDVLHGWIEMAVLANLMEAEYKRQVSEAVRQGGKKDIEGEYMRSKGRKLSMNKKIVG